MKKNPLFKLFIKDKKLRKNKECQKYIRKIEKFLEEQLTVEIVSHYICGYPILLRNDGTIEKIHDFFKDS